MRVSIVRTSRYVQKCRLMRCMLFMVSFDPISSWRSPGSSLSRAALVTFDLFTAITTISTGCPRRPRLAVHTRDTTITERRLLDWNQKNVMDYSGFTITNFNAVFTTLSDTEFLQFELITVR